MVYHCRYGRKKAVVIFLFIKVIGILMSIFGPHYAVFITGRFLMAFGTTGQKLSAYVLGKDLDIYFT